jgi:NAD(P)-dependent dehydrogenase (short-subunit alcohol dehydrogenase family)
VSHPAAERTPAVFAPGLLAGQVALVTGGGTGIGLGISSLLAELGAHVVIASRKPQHLETALAEITGRGHRASVVQLDVRDPERVRAVVDEVAAEHGRIDLLVKNAAGNFYAPSATLSPNAWKAVVEIDLYGTFYCAQAVYPIMARQGGGRIVSTSMTLHYRGWPLMAHATAAKAGVDALTRTLAVEWAPHRRRTQGVHAPRRQRRARPVRRGRGEDGGVCAGQHSAGALGDAAGYRQHGGLSRVSRRRLDYRRHLRGRRWGVVGQERRLMRSVASRHA